MRIRLRLMGVLKSKSPPGDNLDLPDDATIGDVLTALDIAHDSVQAFTINGKFANDKSRTLADQDELSVLPPVGGG